MHKDWILVPRKADDKMKEAAWDHTPLSMDDMTNEDFGRVWEDMIANIPPFPEVQPVMWIACNVGVREPNEPIKELTVRCSAQAKMYADLGWIVTPLHAAPPPRKPEWGTDGKALNLEAAAKDALSDIELVYDATGGWVHDNLYNAMVTLRKYLEGSS